jgi:DNA repair protein RecO (recombination protein O)
MRANLLTRAIILRARPFGESDKIVSFFTEQYGKLTGIAKGALRSRRRFVNSLETFSLINLTFYERAQSNLVFVLAADLIRSPRMLLQDLERIAYASYLVEISEGLVAEREPNLAIFQHLQDGLDYLGENAASLRFLTAFELKLLTLAGYQPIWDHCKRCHLDDNSQRSSWHFSPLDGGLLCDSCAPSRRELLPLGKNAIEVLKALQNGVNNLPAPLSLSHAVVSELRSALLRFVQLQLDREIKSASFLHQFSSV